MLLFDLRDYIQSAGNAPVKDMALHFKVNESEIVQMAEHWEKKGQIRQMPSGSLCQGGCRSCEPETIIIYEWVGNA